MHPRHSWTCGLPPCPPVEQQWWVREDQAALLSHTAPINQDAISIHCGGEDMATTLHSFQTSHYMEQDCSELDLNHGGKSSLSPEQTSTGLKGQIQASRRLMTPRRVCTTEGTTSQGWPWHSTHTIIESGPLP